MVSSILLITSRNRCGCLAIQYCVDDLGNITEVAEEPRAPVIVVPKLEPLQSAFHAWAGSLRTSIDFTPDRGSHRVARRLAPPAIDFRKPNVL
jgi:hypothetical protein